VRKERKAREGHRHRGTGIRPSSRTQSRLVQPKTVFWVADAVKFSPKGQGEPRERGVPNEGDKSGAIKYLAVRERLTNCKP